MYLSLIKFHHHNILYNLEDSGHHSGVGQLLQHLTPEERQSVLNTAAAADNEDLEHFGRYKTHACVFLGRQLCTYSRCDLA